MRIFITGLFTFIMAAAMAQITTPRPSPLSTVQQTVGLTDFTVEYSRPSKKGREIFGALVPYNEMWRTGANASTKLEFTDSVKISGTMVPAGKYALYAIPGETEWTIILHKNLSYWGTGGKNYKQEEDQLRFTVKAEALDFSVETLTINFANLTNTQCNIELVWDNVKVSFPVEVSYDDAVMAQIEEALTISAGTYYSAARYYYENGKDMEKALEWINKAVEEYQRYWVYRYQALILAETGQYEDAIEAAKKSMELAKEAGNNHYVELNQSSIDEWSKK